MRVERLPVGTSIVRERTLRLDLRRAAAACLVTGLALLLLAREACAQVADAAPATEPDSTAEMPASPTGETAETTAADPTGAPADRTAAATSEAEAAPAEPESRVRVSGSLQTRATVQGGDGNDRLSTRLGLEWLAGRWSGGLSLELSNDRGDGAAWGRDGVGSLELAERWLGWRSGGPHDVELRLGTGRGVTFAEGLVLGSPTFDGLELSASLTEHQRLTVIAGRTESLDPDDLLDDDLGLFPEDDDLGDDGRLVGLRHEIRRGAAIVGVNLLHAETDGAPAAVLGSADWAFSRGLLDFASEVAVHEDGGYGAFARTTVTPSDAWGVTVEARRYEDFTSPLDAAPRYEGLSSSDEQDESGGLVRFDFSPTDRFSGAASFDYSQGGDATAGKSSVRRDARLALRWALSDATSLAYGFELEDLAHGRDGRIHSLLLTHSFVKRGRLSARFAFDRATKDLRDSLRVSWRCPLKGRRLTLLLDATLRRDARLTKELQAGVSVRLGTSSFLTCRATVTDDDSESVDVTWYRRF